ncbi:MAG: hypothetical protein WCQ95_08725 [Bacteroidota bacterium]
MAKRKRRPIRNFRSNSTLLFIDMVRTAIKNLTGNTHFTTPTPTLASLTTKVDDLATKEIAARTGGAIETKQMHESRDDLEKDFLKLGLYIELTASGDEAIMITAAYPLTSEETSPALHREFWLEHGANPGEVLAFCKAMAKTPAYIWMFGVGETEPATEKDWTLAGGSTQARMYLTNLDSGTLVWVRVCGITKYGMTPWLAALHLLVV